MRSSVNISLLLTFIAPSLLTGHASATSNPSTVAARQESDLIDPVQQPLCSSCWHWGYPPRDFPGCPVVKSSCPDDENASDNTKESDNRVPKCGIMQYNRDCYCKLKTPIACAWHCDWKGWWQIEDWFAQVCPDAPATKPVDYSGLPSCARQCLDDNMFQSGCVSQTSNCVCARGDLFDCHKKCGDEAEWEQISRWLQDVCGISDVSAAEGLKAGTFSLSSELDPAAKGTDQKKSPPPLPSRRPFRWDEIFVLSAASFVGFTVVVLWVQNCVGRGRSKGNWKVEPTSKGSV